MPLAPLWWQLRRCSIYQHCYAAVVAVLVFIDTAYQGYCMIIKKAIINEQSQCTLSRQYRLKLCQRSNEDRKFSVFDRYSAETRHLGRFAKDYFRHVAPPP